mmetsp:Transcript_57314/g.147869  ORF Transcript_57314/g.147869 Transcript_57314/m.147869 type:complete len:230 (-) Transcript_57314:645-1334(-)
MGGGRQRPSGVAELGPHANEHLRRSLAQHRKLRDARTVRRSRGRRRRFLSPGRGDEPGAQPGDVRHGGCGRFLQLQDSEVHLGDDHGGRLLLRLQRRAAREHDAGPDRLERGRRLLSGRHPRGRAGPEGLLEHHHDEARQPDAAGGHGVSRPGGLTRRLDSRPHQADGSALGCHRGPGRCDTCAAGELSLHGHRRPGLARQCCLAPRRSPWARGDRNADLEVRPLHEGW